MMDYYSVISFCSSCIRCCCIPSTQPIHSLSRPQHKTLAYPTPLQVVHQNMEVASGGVPSFCLFLCILANLFLPPIYIPNQANEENTQRTNQDANNMNSDHNAHMVLVLENGDISQGSKWVNQENQSQAASRIAPNTCETFNK